MRYFGATCPAQNIRFKQNRVVWQMPANGLLKRWHCSIKGVQLKPVKFFAGGFHKVATVLWRALN
ncbi:MAG: hypothetical protein EAY75_08300 [Bacteroidetes bacterium]|nr:MAG: hypothetical protein EAY75_08300 [Bacteroidota bacterium]